MVPFVSSNALPQALIIVAAVEAVGAILTINGKRVHKFRGHVPMRGEVTAACLVQPILIVPTWRRIETPRKGRGEFEKLTKSAKGIHERKKI